LPLPASKGLAFPFLLTSMGAPLHTYNLRPACGRQVRNNGFHSKLRKLQKKAMFFYSSINYDAVLVLAPLFYFGVL